MVSFRSRSETIFYYSSSGFTTYSTKSQKRHVQPISCKVVDKTVIFFEGRHVHRQRQRQTNFADTKVQFLSLGLTEENDLQEWLAPLGQDLLIIKKEFDDLDERVSVWICWLCR